jgi:hypothetical protein
MAALDQGKLIKAKITTNYIGAIIGAAAGYYGAKKFGKVSNKMYLAAAVVGGLILGAYGQSMVSSKGKPKKSDV